LREQANPFVSQGHGDEDYFPLDIVDGVQLDEGDGHRVQVPMHHLPNGDEVKGSQASHDWREGCWQVYAVFRVPASGGCAGTQERDGGWVVEDWCAESADGELEG